MNSLPTYGAVAVAVARDGHFAITFDEHLWTSDCRH
jgi:hypothetical protein